MHEMRHPALVLGSVLMRAVDAALPKHHGVHVKTPRVVAHVLVGGPFAAAVRAVEVERLGLLARSALVVELAIDLVRGCEHEGRIGIGLADRFEDVQRAPCVDVEVRIWVGQRGRDGNLRGEMQDRILIADMFGESGSVPHVLFNEGSARGVLGDEPLQVSFRACAVQVVQDRRVPAALDQVNRGVDTEESRAAGYEDTARAVASWLCRHRGPIP